MLEKSIDEIIKDHFIFLVKKDMEKRIKHEFNEMKDDFVNKVLNNILSDSSFRQAFENKVKGFIIHNIK